MDDVLLSSWLFMSSSMFIKDQEGETSVDEIYMIGFRTIICYFLIVFIFRLLGKRELGELSIVDVVVYIMFAELAVIAIERPRSPFFYTLLPMVILAVIQISLAKLNLFSKKIRDVLEGKPSVIIEKGKIDEETMRKQKYNFDDLMMQLRKQQVRNISDVEYAILETSGDLTVIKKDKEKAGITIPLIMDGRIISSNLKKAKKPRTG